MHSQKKKTKKIKIKLTPEEREELLKDFKIRPNSDIFFVTYFSNPKHEKVLVNLINSVIMDTKWPPIVSAEVLNPFNIKRFAIDKHMILDVRVRDETGRIFDIEIQVTTHGAFNERILGYWADAYAGQLFRGDGYFSLKPVVSIIIVFDNIFPELEDRHQVFRLVSDENPKVSFSDHIAVHVLCLKGVRIDHQEKILDWNEDLQGWSLFLSCEPENLEAQMSVISKKNPVLSEVGEEFERYVSDPKKRAFERRRMLGEAFHRIEHERAIAESEARGEVRGEVRGKAEDAAKKVAHLLGRRFEKIPSQLTEALLRIDDLDKLDKLFDLAFDCTSLEDFKKEID